ncbi:hypothetical protein [Amphibacillus jilinensis]|uniref:hypothetical protein n=1 Tax=Amphibacillus jilinensis TaxID=1216008 RepID=UPI0003110AA1|nr:hypothetical protein [Amphibacillus jilinensis]
MRKRTFKYLDDYFMASHLTLSKDFEVVSFFALTPDQILSSADCFLGVKIEDVIRFRNATATLRYLIEYPTKKPQPYIVPTPMKKEDNKLYFYKLSLPLSVQKAVGMGLGVIRMLTGSYRGEYLLYSIPEVYNHTPGNIMHLTKDILRLKVYIQLILGKKRIDASLKKQWIENKGAILDLLFTDHDYIINQLEKIFS